MKNANVYSKFPLSSIQPRGWINEFLKRQVTGLTGNISVAGYPYNTQLWRTDFIERSHQHTDNVWWRSWWPFEQTSYYLDGAFRVGTLLGNKDLTSLVEKNIEYILNTADENGRFNAKLSGDSWKWPYSQICRIMMEMYEITGEEKYIKGMINHYKTFASGEFSFDLDLANIEQLIWLYEKTEDQTYLENAEESYRLFKKHKSNRDRNNSDLIFGSNRVPDNHGVVYLELLKVPLILYSATRNKEYLYDAQNGRRKMEEHFMLVSGLPSSTEHFQSRNDLSGHETCNTAVLPYTYGYFLRILGDPLLGDKIEKAVFNAGIGSITKDFKSHQYFSSPNQVISTFSSNRYGYYNGFDAYLPGHFVECCTGNVNRFMPYFIEQMYLKYDKGIFIAMYGPSKLNYSKDLSIEQITDYPNDEEITLRIESSRPQKIHLDLRIPDWTSNPTIETSTGIESLDPGTIHQVELEVNGLDTVRLVFPMITKMIKTTTNGVSIERGPLLYSLPIDANKTEIIDYPKTNMDFKAYEMKPNKEWRYALDVDKFYSSKIELKRDETFSYPWDDGHQKTRLRVPFREIKEWNMRRSYSHSLNTVIETTPKIPSTFEVEEETVFLDLVPYGSTLLRMSIFPEFHKDE